MAASEAVSAVSLRGSDLKDPTVLFERYSTEDIRLVERRVRGDIEHKKEELRQMVGERYRDLIDAADTIRDMRHSSESVLRAVTEVGRFCGGLKHGCARPDSTQRGSRPWQQHFFSTAAQIALLLDIPERVWSALEAGQYLKATQLYLLSSHLHSQLQLQPSPGAGACYSPVLARFPILVRQLATTGQFRSSILLDSRSVLRGRAVSDQAIAEALVSSMLLEGSSPRQALSHFLLARKASIQQLLTQPQHGAGIKAQVCSLVELLVTTLFQAYAVFYLPPEGSPKPADGALSCGLLFSTIQSVTSPPAPGESRSVLQDHSSAASWSKHLPPSTLHFQPTLKTLAQPIQSAHLRDALQQWIHTCQEDLAVGVAALLVYVKTLKGLAAIRDAVLELLCTGTISQHWDLVCESLLERPLLVWDHFLEQLFLHRLQAITKDETETISSSCVQLLSSALSDLEDPSSSSSSAAPGVHLEADVASFLWSESAGDLLSDAGWVSVAQRGSQQRSGLAMKTQALTPCVQSLCSSLDTQLKARLEDLQHYLPPQDSEGGSGAAPKVQRKESPAEEALREGSVACVRHILQHIHTQLTRSPQLTPVLFLARLCQSMAELSPSLKQCILGNQAESQPTPKGTPRQSKVSRGRAVEASPAQAQWALVKEELLNCSMEAYRIWSSALSKVLLDDFGTALLSQGPGTVLSCATCWEDLEIQEEAESGSSVTSTIRLPAQPSWFVQALLFRLCVEVNRVGGQALPRATLQELLHTCLSETLHHYTRLTQATQQDSTYPMTQNRALQLLFDLRYLSCTLSSRGDEGRAQPAHEPRLQEACDWLESFIDPFDLDVFTPHMKTNLSRLCQRTSVLLGLLTGLEKQYSSRSLVHSQEASNILPLASTNVRFGLLPLSSSSARKSKSVNRISETAHPLAAPVSSAVSEDPYRPGNLFKQLAQQQDDDSAAASSLFRLGWLSGMTK